MQEGSSQGNNPVQKTGSSTGAKPWMKVLLAISLGANLMVLGLVLGNYLHDRNITGRTGGAIPAEARIMREMGLGPFLNAFPPEQRRELGRSLRDRVGTLQINQMALAGELEAILQAIRAEPYDHSALEAVFDMQKGRIAGRAAEGRNVVLEALQGMSAQERKTFARRMEKSMARALENVRRSRP